jgi:hypothetical protein
MKGYSFYIEQDNEGLDIRGERQIIAAPTLKDAIEAFEEIYPGAIISGFNYMGNIIISRQALAATVGDING